jgi:hypothetical protein
MSNKAKNQKKSESPKIVEKEQHQNEFFDVKAEVVEEKEQSWEDSWQERRLATIVKRKKEALEEELEEDQVLIFAKDDFIIVDKNLFLEGTHFYELINSPFFKDQKFIDLQKFGESEVNEYLDYLGGERDFRLTKDFLAVHEWNGFKLNKNYSYNFLKVKLYEDQVRTFFYKNPKKEYYFLKKIGDLEVNKNIIDQVFKYLPKFAYVAGGSLVTELNSRSDIDVFFAGCSEKEAKDEIERFVKEAKLYKEDKEYTLEKIDIQQRCTTIRYIGKLSRKSDGNRNGRYERLNVQFIHRIYKVVDEIPLGFDVDCCCVIYDGKKLWATPRGEYARIWKENNIDGSRASPSYWHRLLKYAMRGYKMVIPGFDIDKINKDKLLSIVFGFDVKVDDFDGYGEIRKDLIHLCSSRPFSDVFEEIVDVPLYKQPAQVLLFVYSIWGVYPQRGVYLYDLDKDYITYQSKEKEGEKELIFSGDVMGELPEDIKTDEKGRIPKSIRFQTELMDSIKWITENPMQQLTGSFKPETIKDMKNWFKECVAYN